MKYLEVRPIDGYFGKKVAESTFDHGNILSA